ncbi:hypothetical protein PP1Y_Mpl2263 (plasmid) [Novosphingobium sp. PP1Y]|nr:hypothetical protein PP1Y_Mpl2263 [Novosphingobium sp. PP1Y]
MLDQTRGESGLAIESTLAELLPKFLSVIFFNGQARASH